MAFNLISFHPQKESQVMIGLWIRIMYYLVSLQKKIMMLEQILSISNGKNKIEIPKPSVLNPVNPEAIMGLIPSGTRNVLAKSLGLPQGLMLNVEKDGD